LREGKVGRKQHKTKKSERGDWQMGDLNNVQKNAQSEKTGARKEKKTGGPNVRGD